MLSVIIPMGKLRSGSADLYKYLWRSVIDHDGVEASPPGVHATGFVDVGPSRTGGSTIVHTLLGQAPPSRTRRRWA